RNNKNTKNTALPTGSMSFKDTIFEYAVALCSSSRAEYVTEVSRIKFTKRDRI
ncbi:MAG: hypothetical protein ACI90V_012402, partial [Bacillariaceae sp.]